MLSISKVRQDFLKITKNLAGSNQDLVVVSNSAPVLVLVSYEKWKNQQDKLESNSWVKKSKQSFIYDIDEQDNYLVNKLKPLNKVS